MKKWLLPLSVLALSGCELLPLNETELPPVSDTQLAWARHQQQLSGLEAWTLDGRMSITKDEEAWHVSIKWQQIDTVFNIQMFGPFGSGALTLDGTPASVVLTIDGQRIESDDADALLANQTGFDIPVNGLRYWAVGLAAPDLPSTNKLDNQGRLQQLEQAGWRVRYRGYQQNNNGFILPSKVFLNNPELDVRMVIHNWDTVGQASLTQTSAPKKRRPGYIR